MGFNTFAVGSVDANKKVAFNSSYSVQPSLEGVVMKPTLVAPGVNIIIPNTRNSIVTEFVNENGTIEQDFEDSVSGTSFAAPMVTGVIALLLEEIPALMNNPETIMSALIGGATILPEQTSLWDQYAGAGLLNYKVSRGLCFNGQHDNRTVYINMTENSLIFDREVNIEARSSAKFTMVNHIKHSINFPLEDIIHPIFTKYDVKVFDSNNNEIEIEKIGENSNIIVGKIINDSTSNKTYRIKIYIRGSKNTYHDEHITLSVHNHEYISSTYLDNMYHNSYCQCNYSFARTHIYDRWTYNNEMTHIEKCECGAIGTETGLHAIRESDYNKPIAFCIGCGHRLNMKEDFVIRPNSCIQYSLNGSRRIQNGIILLVDEDIESYLNKTLIFNDNNSLK